MPRIFEPSCPSVADIAMHREHSSVLVPLGEFERLMVEADPERLLDRFAAEVAPKRAMLSALGET